MRLHSVADEHNAPTEEIPLGNASGLVSLRFGRPVIVRGKDHDWSRALSLSSRQCGSLSSPHCRQYNTSVAGFPSSAGAGERRRRRRIRICVALLTSPQDQLVNLHPSFPSLFTPLPPRAGLGARVRLPRHALRVRGRRDGRLPRRGHEVGAWAGRGTGTLIAPRGPAVAA